MKRPMRICMNTPDVDDPKKPHAHVDRNVQCNAVVAFTDMLGCCGPEAPHLLAEASSLFCGNPRPSKGRVSPKSVRNPKVRLPLLLLVSCTAPLVPLRSWIITFVIISLLSKQFGRTASAPAPFTNELDEP